MTSRARLTYGPVGKTLVSLSVPMLGAIFSVIAFNLVDTYFVSLLGSEALAAMSFTFPVVMVLFGVASGLSTGTASVMSRAIGAQDEREARRLCGDSLVLSLLSVLAFVAVGIWMIDPLFRLLGATDDVLPLIRDYMLIWYPGIVFFVIPIVANASIRAGGDTKFPALIFTGATILNAILDPLFIFGLYGFPRMELQGAALATVIARATSAVASLLILRYRERLLDFHMPKLREVWQSWRKIGRIAIPATITDLLQPLGLGVVIRLVAGYGEDAVAAWGVGSRLTAFVLIPVSATCSGLVPFIGQNWGAGLVDRIRTARNYGYGFSLIWGIAMLVVLRLLGAPIAGLFSESKETVAEIVRYLSIIPIGYALVGVFDVTEETLNAIGRPLLALVQTIVHVFVFSIPLALLGSHFLELSGLLYGLVGADVLGGILGVGMVARCCAHCGYAAEPLR